MRPAFLLFFVACSHPAPRSGTQIGIEESGGCRDLRAMAVAPDEVPDGASRSLEAMTALLGRFASTDNLILELSVDMDGAEWVEQELLTGDTAAGCPPLWRVPAQVRVFDTEVDWSGAGTVDLWEDGRGYLLAKGVGTPTLPASTQLDEVAGTRLTGHGSEVTWTIDLAWHGPEGADGDAQEEIALHDTLEAAP